MSSTCRDKERELPSYFLIINSNYFRDSLRKRLSSTEDKIEEEEESRNLFVDASRKKILDSNVTIPVLQRDLAEAAANTQTKKRELLNIDQVKLEKR